MRFNVNGELREGERATLADVWRAQAEETGAQEPVGFAIALNGRVVPRARWPQTEVADGDRIEIVRAMAGG